MHLDATPLFLLFCFLLKKKKTAERLTRKRKNQTTSHFSDLKIAILFPSVSHQRMRRRLKTDVEEATTIQGPCGEAMEQTVRLFSL